jgi:hypothetical protein
MKTKLFGVACLCFAFVGAMAVPHPTEAGFLFTFFAVGGLLMVQE